MVVAHEGDHVKAEQEIKTLEKITSSFSLRYQAIEQSSRQKHLRIASVLLVAGIDGKYLNP